MTALGHAMILCGIAAAAIVIGIAAICAFLINRTGADVPRWGQE